MGVKCFFYLVILLEPFCSWSQNRYDVVIDEIMADPTPQIGLPNNEWIELKNTSSSPINLQNWRIGDAGGISGPMSSFTLLPDSAVIICTASSVASMSAYGNTLSVTSFPSLDNDGDQLFLRSANGRTIHAVSYTSGWYHNELKKEGGWTLEMIDPKTPCAGISNWKASVNIAGGTPGKKNSSDAVNIDQNSPRLSRAFTTDNMTIVLVFDEPVDSLSAATVSNYTIDGGIILMSAVTMAPLFNQVQLKTTAPLLSNTIYTLMAANLKDCNNNMIGFANSARVGLPVDPINGEWIINEILFNPRSNAYDYVEFFNYSNKIFDAGKLFIANRNSSGVISSIKTLSATPYYIFPGDHIVITEDADNLYMHYLVKNPANLISIASPPSFPDDEGWVLTLNFQGIVVDEVHYKDDWHFKLIDNDEGVALERIDPGVVSQDPGNWHSAASTAGYGTPTYKNSQYKLNSSVTANFTINPVIFSPDNDGHDDITSIQYELDEPGWLVNIMIFDAGGRMVRSLVRNGTLGLKGYWNWDGLDNQGAKLPVGSYVAFSEIFNLQGKKERFKNTLVLARSLK